MKVLMMKNGEKIPFSYENSDLNISFNLKEMFNWTFDCDYWVDKLEFKTGKEINPLINRAISKMIDYPETAKSFNSYNGWGVYSDALNFLKELEKECNTYKNAYLEISR